VTDSGNNTASKSLPVTVVPAGPALTEYIRFGGQILALEVESVAGSLAGPTVSISPQSAAMVGGGTQVFSASINGAPDPSAAWYTADNALTGSGPTFTYTAPAGYTSDTVIVTDRGSSAQALVQIRTAASVTSTSFQLQEAQTAKVSANAVMSWSLQGVGELSGTGPIAAVTYTAPQSITSNQTVTIIGTDPVNPNNSGSVTISLFKPVLATALAAPASGTAVGYGTPVTVSFSASDSAGFGNPNTYLYLAVGSKAAQYLGLNAINTTTLAASEACILQYNVAANSLTVVQAGSAPSAFCAASLQSTQIVNTTLTVTASVIFVPSTSPYYSEPSVLLPCAQNVWVNIFDNNNQSGWMQQGSWNFSAATMAQAAPTSLLPNQPQYYPNYSAVVVASSSPLNPGLSWSWAPYGVGSLSSATSTSVVYTAPSSIETKQTVTVTGTNTATCVSESANITLNYPPLTISPTSASLYEGQTATFTVTSTGANQQVNWTVGGSGTLSPTYPQTAPQVVYTPPRSINSPHTGRTPTITVTDPLNPARTTTAQITLIPVQVTVSPNISPWNVVAAGQTQQFVAAVTEDTNTNVTWSDGDGLMNWTTTSNPNVVNYTGPPPVGNGVLDSYFLATSATDANAYVEVPVDILPPVVQTLSYANSQISVTLSGNGAPVTGFQIYIGNDFNSPASVQNGCQIWVNVGNWIAFGPNDNWLGAYSAGSQKTAQAPNCSFNWSGATVTPSGNSLSLTLPLSIASSWLGTTQSVHTWASTQSDTVELWIPFTNWSF
jgi:hypothetical protein